MSVGFGATGVVLLLCTLQAVVLQYPSKMALTKSQLETITISCGNCYWGPMTPLQKASNLHTPWRIRIFAPAKVPRVPDGACKSFSYYCKCTGPVVLVLQARIECSQEGKMLLSIPRDSPSPMLSAVAGSDTTPDPE